MFDTLEGLYHRIIITPVNNGYVVSKGTTNYIAFTFNELQQLVKKLLEKEELPDPPF